APGRLRRGGRMALTGCIGADELRAFVLGELPEGPGLAVTAHLEACPACEAAARALDDLADPLIDSLRRVLAVAGPVAPPAGYPGPAPGVLGRFRLVRELGRGGFGVVYLADDPALNRQVALKVPRPEVLASPELRARFLREARAAARLDHPLVVPVFEVGEAGDVCFLVSAYCPGESLAQWLRRQQGPVAPATAAALVAAVADAVEHAHTHG